MKDEINLIGRKVQKKKENKFFIFSLAIFSAVFLVSAVLILYSFMLKSNLANLESESSELKVKIKALNLKKEKILLISERLAAVDKILSSRVKLDEKIGAILEGLPANFSVFSISGASDALSLQIRTDDLSDFDNWMEEGVKGILKKETTGIKRVEMNSFEQDTTGYTSSLRFYY